MSTSFKSNPHHHVRSISLPSRLQSFTPQVDEHLSRLRACKASNSSFSSISNKLSALEDMYISFHDFLLLPNTQQAILRNDMRVEEVLDVRLLDFCAMVKVISLQTEEDVQGLLSLLRRKRDGNELQTYLAARKSIKKMIQKSLKGLKETKTMRLKNESEEICLLFKEVEEVNFDVFESLMSYISGAKSRSILSGIVTRNRCLPMRDEANKNVFDIVDDEVHMFVNTKTGKYENLVQVGSLQRKLEKIESNNRDFEGGLDCLFRRLLKTRVSILNVLNH